jgi:hypothetical protein
LAVETTGGAGENGISSSGADTSKVLLYDKIQKALQAKSFIV